MIIIIIIIIIITVVVTFTERHTGRCRSVNQQLHRSGIAEFAGLEFAGLGNDGVVQEQTYAFKAIRVLFEGIGA